MLVQPLHRCSHGNLMKSANSSDSHLTIWEQGEDVVVQIPAADVCGYGSRLGLVLAPLAPIVDHCEKAFGVLFNKTSRQSFLSRVDLCGADISQPQVDRAGNGVFATTCLQGADMSGSKEADGCLYGSFLSWSSPCCLPSNVYLTFLPPISLVLLG